MDMNSDSYLSNRKDDILKSKYTKEKYLEESDLSKIKKCEEVCPTCGKTCSLGGGHLSSHRCTTGHRWSLDS